MERSKAGTKEKSPDENINKHNVVLFTRYGKSTIIIIIIIITATSWSISIIVGAPTQGYWSVIHSNLIVNSYFSQI